MGSNESFIASGQRTLAIELAAIETLKSRIDQRFAQACQLLLACQGRVIVMGMGKSGHIAGKIAATLASTGTPAYFVHPGEASHGDMGMITSQDAVLALSNSGDTQEIVTLIPWLKRQGITLISITGNPQSALATAAVVNLPTAVAQEACPLGLAPTASTTLQLVMGDALAISLLEARGFTAEDFAYSHPGGVLGRKLLLRVRDIMRQGNRVPVVSQGTALSDALVEVTRKGLGMTAICAANRRVVGIFTDGDLRRALDRGVHPNTTLIDTVMTTDCVTISPDILAAEALKMMDDAKINGLICVDDDRCIVGAINMHDLLAAGVV